MYKLFLCFIGLSEEKFSDLIAVFLHIITEKPKLIVCIDCRGYAIAKAWLSRAFSVHIHRLSFSVY